MVAHKSTSVLKAIHPRIFALAMHPTMLKLPFIGVARLKYGDTSAIEQASETSRTLIVGDNDLRQATYQYSLLDAAKNAQKPDFTC